MKEVKILAKDLVVYKYLILGVSEMIPSEDGQQKRGKVLLKGLSEHKELTEGVKIRLSKIVKALDAEVEVIKKRVEEIKAIPEITEEEINNKISELDNEEIIIQCQPCMLSKVEDLSLVDDEGNPCNYLPLYDKFFE